MAIPFSAGPVELGPGLGYADTVMGGAEHDAYLRMVGRAGYAASMDAGRITVVPGETRTIEIGPGPVFGDVIRDEIPAGIRIQLPEELSGSRYHLIVRRARWGTTNRSLVGAIAGSDVREIPPRETSPGQDADLVLGLVRITAGSPTPTEIVDLRLVAEEPGVYTIFDDMALLLAERLGVVCRNVSTGITWSRVLDETGTPAWHRSGGRKPRVTVSRGTAFSGTFVAWETPMYAGSVVTEGDPDHWMVGYGGASSVAGAPTNPARIEIRAPGTYSIMVRIDASPTVAGQMSVTMKISGASITPSDARPASPGWGDITLTDTRWLPAGAVLTAVLSGLGSVQMQVRRFWISATRIGD